MCCFCQHMILIMEPNFKKIMMKKIFTILFTLVSLISFSQSTTLVISQVYGGGGNSGAPYNADFVELHNVSSVSQSTSGLSVQYASSSATGTWTGVFALPTANIPAGGYFLIRMSTIGTNGVALPTPDAEPSAGNEIAMSSTNGRVALVNGVTALSGCPTTNVIDLVGFGSSVCFETAATPALSNTTAALRNNNGCTDTDNNSSDFTVAAPAPRNSSSTASVCGASSPTLSATALTAFGGVCINTTAGPNSFTITGTSLNTTNVTVGALNGFTYSTSAAGTYTTSLSLTQPGGSFTQEIFVKFTPTAVQTYDGDIAVGGGGATSINVAASGSGINAPALTTGAASNITQVSATLAGTITSEGCSAVTAYGIEYSTTAGFPNGTGTPVASTNISGGNFSSNITGLTAATTYYYHAYATNTQGTGYGTEKSFTTSTASTPGMVISQVYGGGGNSSATYNQDFVELFNRSTATIDISGWSVQYASATGPGGAGDWAVTTIPASTTVAPGKYFLIALATGATGGALPTPDLTNTAVNMSGSAGKVALVNNAVALNGTTACSSATVVDVIGYGSTATCSETSPFITTGIDNTKSIFRKMNGCTDDNNNSTDFEILAVSPRNSASAANVCGAASPVLTATALTAFGNVCINTTAGPNSFTITGTNLTAADVTVAALAGFTYSTTSGGTYTTTLNITQPGGSFTQEVFVKFTPTAVQSYNGDIAVGGGGATSINVAAAGAGINISVTTGASSAVTSNSATLAGTATTTCAAITAYGIEYSTTNNFPNGSGTQVPSTNINGSGNYTSDVTGLTAATTYYYKAYATNAQGTTYGVQESFTTGTASTPDMVISQVYGGGGNSSATYNQDFVELFNRSTATIDISGWSVQYASATGPGGAGDWAVTTIPASTTVAPGKYFLIALATGATGGALPTPDLTNTAVNMSGSAGKVALVNNAVALNGTTACSSATVVDVIGYGSTATCSETSPFITTGIDNTKSIFRKMNGCTDDNNNSTDFEILAVSPRNSASAANVCGAASPVLTATALTAFGNVCINTTAGPNSFTITGTNLTAADVTVAALAGFTYSTTSGGTYTTTLNITQPGGSFTQEVFVKFTPTAVQSYNGDIAVGGGGATSINVAAAGAGINISVTTGASSAVTSNSATLAGTATTTCAAITAYGIEYSTTNNFPNGSGTQVPSTNINGSGNYTSDVTGLTAATTYYYKAYATNAQGTTYGTQQSLTTISTTPVLTATSLAGFGNVCLNTVAGPNSFTINGANLTAADINVGPLSGFSFSTTSGGTYTNTLTLTQPGGTYTQQVFVQFNPVAVQSYNGNIAVTGGGATSVNVAATGAGVNTAASVTSGAASAITQTTATVAGSIPATGCSAVTAYGIEYSTTNNFPTGTGTQAASTNLSGINFSSALNGLSASTVYYYRAYATNAGGTTYGSQLSFTTAAPVLTATPLTAFGPVCVNTTAGPMSFVINSTFVTAANINVGPLAGYSFATTSGGTYTASLSLVHAAGPYTQTIYVQFAPTAVQSYSGNIPVSGGGAAAINVVASGSGINSGATVNTGNATILSPNAVTLNGDIATAGCSQVTAYGIEYSGISGLANGLGTKVAANNLNSNSFSVTLNGLVQAGTYYYKAYAVNSGGTTYGVEKSFTTTSIPNGFVIYSIPVKKGENLHYSYKGIAPGHYQIQIFNSIGQLVFERPVITQVNFIDDNFILPGNIAPGVYSMHIVSPGFRDKKIFMIR